MADQKRLGIADEDPLFLGAELLATFQQIIIWVELIRFSQRHAHRQRWNAVQSSR